MAACSGYGAPTPAFDDVLDSAVNSARDYDAAPAYDVEPVSHYTARVDPGYDQQPNMPNMPNPFSPPQPHIPNMPNPFTPAPLEDDCEDCGELVRTTRRVQIPCTRNTYRQYEVKIPRQVTEKVAKQVRYMDMEQVPKNVTYTVNREETRFREESQQYNVPVTKQKTRMVTVTKKVPKTIYVDVTVQEPQSYTVVENEFRTRSVKIPYTVNVPEERTKVVMSAMPVEKVRTVYEDNVRTVYDTQMKTELHPVTTMITKEIPVYHWNPKPAGPCNDCEAVEPVQPMPMPLPQPMPQPDPQPQPAPDRGYMTERVKVTYEAPKAYDSNNDGILDEEERAQAAKDGVLKKSIGGEEVMKNLDQQVGDNTDEELEDAQGAAQGALGAVMGAPAQASQAAQKAVKRRSKKSRSRSSSRGRKGSRKSSSSRRRRSRK